MQTWQSNIMQKKHYIISVLSGGLFASVFVFVIIRYFADDGGWIMRLDQPILSFLIIYVLGILAAGLYFYKDYLQYKGQTLTVNGANVTFDQNDKSATYNLLELRSHKSSRTIYGWFGFRKMVIQFKSIKDFRRYQYVLLIKSDEETPLLEALKTAHKKAIKSQKTT